jgi:hypothetical protein
VPGIAGIGVDTPLAVTTLSARLAIQGPPRPSARRERNRCSGTCPQPKTFATGLQPRLLRLMQVAAELVMPSRGEWSRIEVGGARRAVAIRTRCLVAVPMWDEHMKHVETST